jgi:hypothetical protein
MADIVFIPFASNVSFLRFFSGIMMLFPQMTHATVIGENFLSPKTAHEPFEKIKNQQKKRK